ncbi:hypothetical protein PG989_008544 [Apiospora arundinis]
MSTQGDTGKDVKAGQEGKDSKDPWSKENKNKFQNPEASSSIPAKKPPSEAYDALTETAATERCVQIISSEFRDLRGQAHRLSPSAQSHGHTQFETNGRDRAYRNCKKEWIERRKKEKSGIFW